MIMAGIGCRAEEESSFESDYWKAEHKLNLMWEIANTHKESGKLDEALEKAQKIIEYSLPMDTSFQPSVEGQGNRLQVYAFMAEIEKERGNHEASLAHIAAGVQAISKSEGLPVSVSHQLQAALHEMAGHVHKERGESDKATAEFEKAIELMP